MRGLTRLRCRKYSAQHRKRGPRKSLAVVIGKRAVAESVNMNSRTAIRRWNGQHRVIHSDRARPPPLPRAARKKAAVVAS